MSRVTCLCHMSCDTSLLRSLLAPHPSLARGLGTASVGLCSTAVENLYRNLDSHIPSRWYFFQSGVFGIEGYATDCSVNPFGISPKFQSRPHTPVLQYLSVSCSQTGHSPNVNQYPSFQISLLYPSVNLGSSPYLSCQPTNPLSKT